MEAILSKEYIESLLANKYMGANNYRWNDTTVYFDYDRVKDEEYVEDNNNLNMIIQTLQMQIIELKAMLAQAERDNRIAIQEITQSFLVEGEEDGK